MMTAFMWAKRCIGARTIALQVLVIALVSPALMAAAPANVIDDVSLHPAIPLLDEDGASVLESGKPYSPRNSCGLGSGGCHDYAGISHGDHFERGRDEADDQLWRQKGWFSHITSPGYFGGFNSEGPGILARKGNGGLDPFPADWGAAGMVQQCIECHNGGGWSELDRDGIRYDQKRVSAIAEWDGDYFNRGSDGNNAPADGNTVKRWDWQKSGVVENDCLMCHADYSHLKIFPGTRAVEPDPTAWYVQALGETPSQAFGTWFKTRNTDLVKTGFFREAATALLEVMDIRPETADGMNLVTLARLENGDLELGEGGQPKLSWNPAAFDTNQKVTIPMRKFPANDNCWQCHGNRVGQDRRAFWGFGEAARPLRQEVPGGSGNARPIPEAFTYEKDVHKGAKYTDDNGQQRVIDNCNACHTQGIYYRPNFANVALDATHNFAKGNSDIDIRRDLDYQPAVKSCEYCHQNASKRANPSDPKSEVKLNELHRRRWDELKYLVGVSDKSKLGLVNTHLDDVACQSCHIPADLAQCPDPDKSSSAQRTSCDAGLRNFDGSTFPILYRYRTSEDGSLKAAPYNAKYQFRYYWRDKKSGRILTQSELNSVYTAKRDGSGNIVALRLTQPSNGKVFELSGGQKDLQGASAFYDWGPQFPQGDVYGATLALKEVYDSLLSGKGYDTPDVQMIWTESNDYLVSHNTQPAANAVPCQGCHDRARSGLWNGALKAVFGAEKAVVLNGHADKRLADKGVVVFDKPYYKFRKPADPKAIPNEIIATAEDLRYASQIDPSMSVLKADKADRARGEMALLDLDQALRRLAGNDARNQQVFAPLLGTENAFVLRFATGTSALRSLAVAAPDLPLARALFRNARIELGGRSIADADRRLIRQGNLGKPASDVQTLRAYAAQGRDELDGLNVTTFVKVPYNGNMCAPSQIRVVRIVDGKPLKTELPVVAVKPRAAAGSNYAVLSTEQTLGDFVLTDVVANPKRALKRAEALLVRATRASAAAGRAAARAAGRATAAATASTAAATGAAALQSEYDAASDANKPSLKRALDKAKAKAAKAATTAARLQAVADLAAQLQVQAQSRQQAAAQAVEQSKCAG